MKHCIVVGGGPGGLYAGYRLGRAGHSYEILEASDRAGGRVQTLQRQGSYIDVGAQVYHSSYKLTDELISEFGLQKVPVNGNAHYIMENGQQWIQGSNGFLKGLGWKGNASLIRYILTNVVFSTRPELHKIESVLKGDTVSAQAYFESLGADAFSEYLVPLLCAAMNVSAPSETSLQHLQHIFRITAFTDFYTLECGNEMLWQKLAGKVNLSLGSKVDELLFEGGKVSGVRLAGTGEEKQADSVILTLPPPAMLDVLPRQMTARRSFYDSLSKSAQVIPMVYLNRELEGNIANYMGDMRSELTYLFALDVTKKAPSLVQGRNSILTLWDYHPKSLELQGASDSKITQRALKDLKYLIPGFNEEWVAEVELIKHPYSHPPYGVGSYQKIVGFLRDDDNSSGVYLSGDVFGGSYMECALISAKQAVERVLAS